MSTTTSPYELAEEICGDHGVVLADDIIEYSRRGYVFIAPEYVLIGCRLGDGWFIRLAVGAGCLNKFLELMPYYLPYVGWARMVRGRHQVVWHDTEKVRRAINIC